SRKPDLVILDLGLPDKDGLCFIQDFRQWSSTPIIVLSARDSEQDKVDALDAGADDYLTKPFGMSELLARVRASLRRFVKQETETTQFTFGDITIDWVKRIVTRQGVP
ncbi:response regulator, partial [Klebsiella aerogenes]|nr:response regulator [Klebsiella aerogenes]